MATKIASAKVVMKEYEYSCQNFDSLDVLLVIPALNESRCIASVIDTLLSGVPDDLKTICVVADGGSVDGTQSIVEEIRVKRPQVLLMNNPKKLQSAGVNEAVKNYGDNAKYLVRCDAHANYPEDFIKKLLVSLEETNADAIVVPMDSIGITRLQKAIAWVSDTPIGSGGSAHRGGRRSGYVDHGHHAAFKMDVFRKTGGYDESFSHNEDAEFDCRQRHLGFRIFLDSKIRVGYFPRETISGLWRQYFGYGRGRSRTVRKHPSSLRLRQFAVPVNLVISGFSLIASAWFSWLIIWPVFYVLALVYFSVKLAIKHRSASGLLAGLAAFVMHTSWALGFLNGMLTIREKKWSLDQLKKI